MPAQVMDLLGQSLWDVWNTAGQVMSDQYVACIAVEALTILEQLHKKGWAPVHLLCSDAAVPAVTEQGPLKDGVGG